jgi:hypothetical protein
MTDEKKDVGYLFQVSCDLGNGRNCVISGNFDKQASKDLMGHELDKINTVLERQRAAAEVPLLETELALRNERLRGVQEEFERLNAKQIAGEKLTSQDKMNLQNFQASITGAKADIERGQRELDVRKALVG